MSDPVYESTANIEDDDPGAVFEGGDKATVIEGQRQTLYEELVTCFELIDSLKTLQPTRELALARTKLEEAMLWFGAHCGATWKGPQA